MKTKITVLTPMGVILRVIRKISLLNKFSQSILQYIILKQGLRDKLNSLYNRLNFDEKGVFHTIFYKTFRNKDHITEGIWITDFLKSQIELPLRSKMAWLDWEHASAILGHDIDVKETYETLLSSNYRPKVFFDIGANYGMHSLLLLAQGVKTISFEPNYNCKEQFEIYCRMNDFNGVMEGFAIGDREDNTELWFPEKEPWLGTIVDKTKQEYSQTRNLTKIQVPLTSIDRYTESSGIYPDLIKIDTEGNELNVIKGAIQVIKSAKPLIIFECNELNNKNELLEMFHKLKYEVCRLPLLPRTEVKVLQLEEFLASDSYNFLALPKDHSILQKL